MTICTVGKVVISNKIHFDQVSKIRQKHYDLNTVSIVVNKMGNKIRTEKRKGKIRESRCLLIIIICNPLEGVGSSRAQWGQNILKLNLNFLLIFIYTTRHHVLKFRYYLDWKSKIKLVKSSEIFGSMEIQIWFFKNI